MSPIFSVYNPMYYYSVPKKILNLAQICPNSQMLGGAAAPLPPTPPCTSINIPIKNYLLIDQICAPFGTFCALPLP